MSAKPSKKNVQAFEASPPGRTPQRNRRQSPSKVPQEKSRSNVTTASNRSNRRSSRSDDNSQSNSENDSDENDSIDFLGRPPSHEPSESNQNTQDSDENDNDSSQQSSNQQSTRITFQRPSIGKKQSTRKQTKPTRIKPVLKEIMKLQKSTNLLMPRLPFQRLVREVLQQFKNDFRLQSRALECLQEASESYLIQLFEDSYLCCLHRSRATLTDKDLRLVQVLRGPQDVGRK